MANIALAEQHVVAYNKHVSNVSTISWEEDPDIELKRQALEAFNESRGYGGDDDSFCHLATSVHHGAKCGPLLDFVDPNPKVLA